MYKYEETKTNIHNHQHKNASYSSFLFLLPNMCVDVSVCKCIENPIEVQESNSTIFVIGTEKVF